MEHLDFSVAVFQRRTNHHNSWWALGFADAAGRPVSVAGRSASKLREQFVASCRESLRDRLPQQLPELQLIRGRRLLRIETTIAVRRGGRRHRFVGQLPIIVEPRPLGPNKTLRIAYHPLRQHEWFPLADPEQLSQLATAVFGRYWSAAELEDEQLEQLRCQGSEKLQIIGFRSPIKGLLSRLSRQQAPGMAKIGSRRRRAGTSLLRELAFDITRRAADGELNLGMPREPYREQLRQLLCGARKAPTLLVGPSGVGKTTLLRRAVADLLEADGWSTHQNLDRVHHVWQLSGRRIIAGMSYLGQWEQRCVELLEETYGKRVVLWIEDLPAWGRIGESRDSDRSLATFFRGPIARGELSVIASCTAEQYQQLQADAAALANAFTTIHVEPTDSATTLRMLIHEARAIELAGGCVFRPRIYRSIYELSGSLDSGSAFPGKALELVRALAARHRRKSTLFDALLLDEGWPGAPGQPGAQTLSKPGLRARRVHIGTPELITMLSERTGMPELLLAPERPLDADEVAASFTTQIMGQAEAVAVVRDLVVRIKAGLCDPGRPYGVFLFTGPTGTGKTEMAKALAEYLFGDESRLLRYDMSEYNVPGAAARLIGDRFQPQGQLTSRVRAQPFCVVLLDEVEKADPSVLNLMLQLFDDGRLSDAAGELANFRHSVVIMTSNLGAGQGSPVGFGGGDGKAVLRDIARAVREFFPPELFNRIDRVVQFHPLDRSAAEAIARKELDRLLTRRGLRERNVFVHTTKAVLETVVREGFNDRDGARSLKRWLEDNIGSLLVETLTASRGATMRLLWLYVRQSDGRLAVHDEALREAEPIPEHSRVSELLEQPNAALLAQVPTALGFLRDLERSPKLSRLSHTLAALLEAYNQRRNASSETAAKEAETETATEAETEADALYNLETLRSEIAGLRDALELHANYDQRLETGIGDELDEDERREKLGEQLELDKFEHERFTVGQRRIWRTRRLSRRQLSPDLPLRGREAMLRAIAEVWFLESALERADEPEQHVVFLELSRIGGRQPSARFASVESQLFAALARAYIERGRGELEAYAALDETGAIVAARSEDSDAARERATELASQPATQTLVLQLVGPSVREFFAGDAGCQVLETLGGSQEIVRVRLLDGRPGDSPRELIHRTLARRQAFVAALEAGDGTELPANPDRMLPILRRFKLEEARAGRPALLEVEDYPLSHASSHDGAKLDALLPLLWLMRVGVALGDTSDNTSNGATP